jgi:hypothetical protein
MTLEQFRAALKHYAEMIASIEADLGVAAKRRAQYIYLGGTFLGVLGLVPLLVAGAVVARIAGHSVLHDSRLATAFACAVAGGFGACASVSWRVSLFRGLDVDAGASILTLRSLGMVRPWIGALFGVAFYFALKSGFVDIGDHNRNFYFFAFLSFVAGFSERMIPDLLRSTEQKFAGSSGNTGGTAAST